MGKELGQPGAGHLEDNGPMQGATLPPVSLCLQRAVRGDPNLILYGYPEVIIILFGGLKQEVRYLWGLLSLGLGPLWGLASHATCGVLTISASHSHRRIGCAADGSCKRSSSHDGEAKIKGT